MKSNRNYSYNGKCPKVHNELKARAFKSMIDYTTDCKLIKKAERTDKQNVRSIHFDVDVEKYMHGKQNTKKYHRTDNGKDFTRIVVNGKTLFVFDS